MGGEAGTDPPDCFHCGLPIPKGLTLFADVLGEARPMCCIGCCAVAEMLEAQGLSEWYRRRKGATGFRGPFLPDLDDQFAYLESPALEEEFIEHDSGGSVHASLLVEGLSCAACVWIIERHLLAREGIRSVRTSLASRRVQVEWDPERIHLRDIVLRLAEIGFAARPAQPGESDELERKEDRAALIRMGVAGLGAMNVMTYSVALYAGAFDEMSEAAVGLMRWMGLIVSTPVVLFSARPFFRAAWREIRLAAPGMDVPVAIAIGGAYAVSLYATIRGTGEVYFDSVCMFTFFLSVGRYLEMRIRHRSSSLTRSMIDATPAFARRVRDDEGERVVPAHALGVGDRFRVRPGESLPADGIVLEGRSAVEEALVTGEPWPRPVTVGAAVIAGGINVESPLLVEATRVGERTTLASILALIERAQSERPKVARTADRVAVAFVSGVLGVAVFNWIAWQFIAPERAMWTTLAVLVATCPCALSLATPTALAAATHALARAGLVITSGRVLEGLASADRILFDKTGTLTRGQPTLTRIVPVRGHEEAEVLALARTLERDSEHPYAHALRVAGEDGVHSGSAEVGDQQEVASVTGFGVEGSIAGTRYRIGRPEWAASSSGEPPPEGETADAMDGSAAVFRVWILLADEKGPLAWFGLEDPVRKDARAALEALRERGFRLEMLTGDPSPSALAIADRLGFDVAEGGVTPEGKVERVRLLQARGERVAVVGDGVNDGPLMRAGDVSIAMGSGCDLSRLGADAVLLRNELTLIPRAVEWSLRMKRILAQNFGWAIAYNLLVLPLAVSGQLAPWVAALGMSTSSLVVVLNSLRLNRLREAG